MKKTLHHQIHGGINPLLAALLSAIALGGGILAWEWHHAHSAKSKHSASIGSHHHHGKGHHKADAAGATG